MRKIVCFLLIVLSIALGGCTTPRGLSESGISPKRVGVISIVAETATLNYGGFTVFGNERKYIPIRNWNLDRKLEQMLIDGLASHKTSSFVVINIDRNTVLANYNSRTLRPDWSPWLPKLVEIGRSNQVDALLVVTPGVFDANFGEQWPFSGLGMMSRGAGGDHPSWATAYLGARLHLVDVKSGSVAADRLAATNLEVTNWSTYAAPSVNLDTKIWKTNFNQVSPEQEAQLAQSFEPMSHIVVQNAQRLFGIR